MHVRLSVHQEIAELTLQRGRVNAVDEQLVRELSSCLHQLAEDPTVRGTVLTGSGNFFSFGFDVPHFLDYPAEKFTQFLYEFTTLYREMFSHPKPIVAAVNGHAVAGGCMLASACDARFMVSGKAKIGLNEIGFGSSLFAGSVAMLKYWVGERWAQEIIYSGKLYSAGEAQTFGLVDAVTSENGLLDAARNAVRSSATKEPAAFRSLKGLLRKPVVEEMIEREAESIREFVGIWYCEPTRKNLHEITIRA
jgi:Delta3-Delta2-enoyl-CoA isomerase